MTVSQRDHAMTVIDAIDVISFRKSSRCVYKVSKNFIHRHKLKQFESCTEAAVLFSYCDTYSYITYVLLSIEGRKSVVIQF